jgi:tRNA 2-thiouridine synthesizing protein A
MLRHAELNDSNDRIEVLDLRDENCPFTFIKTKLKLEEMKKGEELKVIFSDEVTARDVAKSLTSEGHEVLEVLEIHGAQLKGIDGWMLRVRCGR